MSNLDIVKAELEAPANKLSADEVEAQLEKLTEDGKIDAFATQIRNDVNESIKTITGQRETFFNELKTKEATRSSEEKKAFATNLEKELKGVTEFGGLKLHETVPSGIVRKFEQGAYDFKDPKFVSKAIMAVEFYEQAIKEMKQKTTADVLKEQMKSLTNTPTQNSAKNVVVSANKNGHYHEEIEKQFARK